MILIASSGRGLSKPANCFIRIPCQTWPRRGIQAASTSGAGDRRSLTTLLYVMLKGGGVGLTIDSTRIVFLASLGGFSGRKSPVVVAAIGYAGFFRTPEGCPVIFVGRW